VHTGPHGNRRKTIKAHQSIPAQHSYNADILLFADPIHLRHRSLYRLQSRDVYQRCKFKDYEHREHDQPEDRC